MKIDNAQEILEMIRNKTGNLKTKHNILKSIYDFSECKVFNTLANQELVDHIQKYEQIGA